MDSMMPHAAAGNQRQGNGGAELVLVHNRHQGGGQRNDDGRRQQLITLYVEMEEQRPLPSFTASRQCREPHKQDLHSDNRHVTLFFSRQQPAFSSKAKLTVLEHIFLRSSFNTCRRALAHYVLPV
jgi:hypothetical protein